MSSWGIGCVVETKQARCCGGALLSSTMHILISVHIWSTSVVVLNMANLFVLSLYVPFFSVIKRVETHDQPWRPMDITKVAGAF